VFLSTCLLVLQAEAPLKYRLVLQVPEWIDAIFPGVRKLLETVQAKNARMQFGKRLANDLIQTRPLKILLACLLTNTHNNIPSWAWFADMQLQTSP